MSSSPWPMARLIWSLFELSIPWWKKKKYWSLTNSFDDVSLLLYFLFYTFAVISKLMKVFARLLSLYILVLTAVPCFDVPQDQALAKTELSQQNDASRQQDMDSCSPFCVCDCCQISIFVNSMPNLQCFPVHSPKFIEYPRNIQDTTLFDFLKPPIYHS